MKKFNTTTLTNQLEKVNAILEKREEHADSKSEKWSDSEKGEHFINQTVELEYLRDDLENLIDAFDSWNDENESI